MVNHSTQSLDRVFHALSDPTRREILSMLTQRQHNIGELADPFRMSLAAVSKHIQVLEDAGLLTRARDGRIHRCMMNAHPLKEAQSLISFYQEFWEKQFRALDRYLQESLNPSESGHAAKGVKNGRRKK